MVPATIVLPRNSRINANRSSERPEQDRTNLSMCHPERWVVGVGGAKGLLPKARRLCEANSDRKQNRADRRPRERIRNAEPPLGSRPFTPLTPAHPSLRVTHSGVAPVFQVSGMTRAS